jgi:flagellar biosynthesis regulator FlbT
MTMTTQYDTQYLDSLSILELRQLQAKIALILLERCGKEKYEELFKKAITELAETVGLGVIFH